MYDCQKTGRGDRRTCPQGSLSPLHHEVEAGFLTWGSGLGFGADEGAFVSFS